MKFLFVTDGTMYSRMNQVKVFKGCLPQILLGPLNTLSQIMVEEQCQENNLSTTNLICEKNQNYLYYWEQLVLT